MGRALSGMDMEKNRRRGTVIFSLGQEKKKEGFGGGLKTVNLGERKEKEREMPRKDSNPFLFSRRNGEKKEKK